MEYYKVKPSADQIPVAFGSSHRFIANELITKKEAKRMKADQKRLNEHCELIEHSKNNTYWCFGARFKAKHK